MNGKVFIVDFNMDLAATWHWQLLVVSNSGHSNRKEMPLPDVALRPELINEAGNHYRKKLKLRNNLGRLWKRLSSGESPSSAALLHCLTSIGTYRKREIVYLKYIDYIKIRRFT